MWMGLVCGLRWHALVLVDEARATLHAHVADAGDVQTDRFGFNITLPPWKSCAGLPWWCVCPWSSNEGGSLEQERKVAALFFRRCRRGEALCCALSARVEPECVNGRLRRGREKGEESVVGRG